MYGNNNSSIISSGVPSDADASNYFYLPALGHYDISGRLAGVGTYGAYWSSSADPWSYSGYYMKFYRGVVDMNITSRALGNRAQKFSYFGDN